MRQTIVMHYSLYAVLVLTILSGCGPSRKEPVTTWRFQVANQRLFALGSGSYFGTEGPIYTTDDLGRSWTAVNAPKSTCDLAGDGGTLYALTSKGDVWTQAASDRPWNCLRRNCGNGLLYSMLVSKAGMIGIVGSEEVVLLNTHGDILERIPTPRAPADAFGKMLFVRAFFASSDEQQVIIEASPFAVFVLDVRTRKLASWTDGMSSDREKGLHGPCRVARHGTCYLMSAHDGVYAAEGLLKPWQKLLSMGKTFEERIQGDFCRAFCSLDATEDRWLMADGSGIHVMQGRKRERRVFADEEGECHLILDMTQFGGRYFVSFSRLASDTLGVVLPADLSNAQTLRFATP